MTQPPDEFQRAKRITEAVEANLLTEDHVVQLARTLQMGHTTVTQEEREIVLVWAIEILEDMQILLAALEGTLLIGVENGKVVYGDPNDVAQ